MGALLSRWRAKPTTVEILEKMEKDIQCLEEFRDKNQKLRKIWVGRLLIYSSILYLFTCFVVYLWYIPDGLTAKLLIIFPFLLFPVLIWFVRTLLIVWFGRRMERNNDALEDLKAQKKKILEEVMEKETYKAAKLILERFDPDSKKIKDLEHPVAGAPITPRPGQDLRQRTAAQRNISVSTPVNQSQGSPQVAMLLAATPGLQRDTSAPGAPPERAIQPAVLPNLVVRRPGSPAPSVSGMAIHPPGPPLARPILPRERGAVDRVIEYLVGDGPQNRYALICQQCFSHNGMALKEEFEYIAFRCAYCYFLNPARKTRPQAPRLQEFNFERPRTDSQGSISAGQVTTDEQLENQTSAETPEESEAESQATTVTEDMADDLCTEQEDDKIPEETPADKSAEQEIKMPTASVVDESEESLMETE
ncbi:endoplasmic reticulum junction formation protein lunapark [Spea bombifrons]|uniref:endoplasmic reticulum junction formation protein lunapark n=1 Tax=Spea bombifrons TaxID=233779 RepID=UPI00234A5F2E|nr:endoplasmic reticulum junction formation protein lunapark [Spea bombifrons]XP_053327332.1 endoplasmic reticulum junction formation protein lunapark [Spea bombifrons]